MTTKEVDGMQGFLAGLYTIAPVHYGIGQVASVIDLPVAREVVTGYPWFPGPGVKGALRAWHNCWYPDNSPTVEEVFGTKDGAGAISISDAKLLLLPIRCLSGSPFRWLICPHILRRFSRDAKRLDMSLTFADIVDWTDEQVWGESESAVILEEYAYTVSAANKTWFNSLISDIEPFLPDDGARSLLSKRLLVVPDGIFADYARYYLQVDARNVLNENKISDNLWYEESVPPETAFYFTVEKRCGFLGENLSGKVAEQFVEHPYIHIGGDETVGRGWCAITGKASTGKGVSN